MNEHPTLAWVMPVYGNIHRLVYESHMAALGSLVKDGITVIPKFVMVTNKMGLSSASNMIVKAVLELKPDYIFWTEMDMVLPSHSVRTLYKNMTTHNLDVLAGVYFLRGNGQPCLYKQIVWSKANPYSHTPIFTFPKNAIFQVGCPGMGCVLLKREVFEKLEEPWFDDQEKKCGTDMYFYHNLSEKGVKVYADSSVLCDQIDEDTPRVWGLEDYNKWILEKGPKLGFIHSDKNYIPVEEVHDILVGNQCANGT